MLGIVVAALVLTSMLGCDTDAGDSLFDPDRPFRPDPLVTAVEPAGSTLAGVGTVTIMGENFSPVAEENLAYFGGERVPVLEATETQLIVQPPTQPAADLGIRVNVVGAENYSNVVTYSLLAAVESFGGIADFEESHAIATDDESNLHVSLFVNNASAGIKRITPDGTRHDYISSPFKWDAMVVDSDGTLFGVRNVRAIFRFAPGGGEQEVWAVASSTAARFVAITRGEGFIWAAGFGGSIYRADASANLETFPVEGNVRSLIVHEGGLYAAVTTDGSSSVVRFPIEGGQLGAAEEIFSVTDFAGAGVEALSLAATRDGALFVGTTASDPLILVEPDGSGESFYPGLMRPPAFSLAWGEGSTLYMSRTDVPGRPSRILKINTQREGPR